jgi:transposase
MIEQVYELADELCRCPSCQAERKKIGSAISYTIEDVPGSLVRIRHVQHKYACRQCEQSGHNPNITLADKTNSSPIDKGMPGPGLLAHVATSKFSDYLPLHHLETIFAREGFQLDRSTMCLWMADVARLVRPLYDWGTSRAAIARAGDRRHGHADAAAGQNKESPHAVLSGR